METITPFVPVKKQAVRGTWYKGLAVSVKLIVFMTSFIICRLSIERSPIALRRLHILAKRVSFKDLRIKHT